MVHFRATNRFRRILIAAVAELIGRRLIYQKLSRSLFLISYGILRVSLGVLYAFRVRIFLRDGIFNYSALLGGWNPVMFLGFIPGAVWFALKFSSVVFLLIWFRVTFPRIRGDQLMEFGWKVLLPIALANIFLTALIKELFF